MTLDDFKEIHAGDTAKRKLDLLIENESFRRMDAVSAERDRMNRNVKGEAYWRSEERHMQQRVFWLYKEIMKALDAMESRHRLEVHNIGNVDIPEGVTTEQFHRVMNNVVEALEHTEKGESWPYEDDGGDGDGQ